MESAANLLVKHFRQVLVRASYENHVRIRFRADDLRDPRCFFNKVSSQRKKWEERGGALITWRDDNREGPHDAILFVECPKSMEHLYRAQLATRTVGVVYEPPTWKPFVDLLHWRHSEHPAKLKRQLERLEIIRAFVEALPPFTPKRLSTLLRARQVSSQSSSSPGSPVASAPSLGTNG